MLSNLNFHPDHLEDLRKSGLSDETIIGAGIRSFGSEEINKHLGFNLSGMISMYEIPYGNGFSRYRVFYGDGQKGPKYIQPKGTGNRLYIPKQLEAILKDSSIPICITEGEKKALKAIQMGIHCIGLAGLWNWSNGNKKLIGDFDLISFKQRKVFIIPDNDYLHSDKRGYRKNLKEAVSCLARLLKQRDAEVHIIELPSGRLKGLDDYLCRFTIEDLWKLPQKQFLTLEEEIDQATPEKIQSLLKRIAEEAKTETEKDIFINLLSTRFDLSKRSIQKDLKGMCPSKADNNDAMIEITAQFPGLVDLVKDEKGNVAFLVKENNQLKMINRFKSNDNVFAPPDSTHLPFHLVSGDDVLRSYVRGTDPELYDAVLKDLKKYSYLSDQQWIILCNFVFLTYLQDHQDIFYLPMILFFAVPERGKSRTGKSMTHVCYRGVHCVDLRESNLFRYSENMRATIFLDIMDFWKKAQQNQSTDILLQRYEKGSTVPRVLHPEKGPFEDTKHFKVYGPTIIASNEAVHKILDTRCIPFSMPNKPGRYDNPSQDKALPIKTRLTAWRAHHMDKTLPIIDPVKGIEGRLWDITKPLLQVCKIVAPNQYGNLVDALVEIAEQRRSDRGATFEGRIVSIVYELSAPYVDTADPSWEIPTMDVLEKFNSGREEDKKKTPQWLGRKLKAIGIRTSRKTGRSKIIMTPEEISTLEDQYGLIEEYADTTQANSGNSDNSIIGGMNKSYLPYSGTMPQIHPIPINPQGSKTSA